MDTIVWASSYSVGVKILDEQHQNIIKMINLLGSQSENNVSSEVVSDILNRLTAYASEHFKMEEKILEEYGYPDLEDQQTDHRSYRFKVVELCQDTMQHQQSVPDDLLQFLQEWWIAHILESDMQYKEFFAERGVQ